jgi:hypothetical protein
MTREVRSARSRQERGKELKRGGMDVNMAKDGGGAQERLTHLVKRHLR